MTYEYEGFVPPINSTTTLILSSLNISLGSVVMMLASIFAVRFFVLLEINIFFILIL